MKPFAPRKVYKDRYHGLDVKTIFTGGGTLALAAVEITGANLPGMIEAKRETDHKLWKLSAKSFELPDGLAGYYSSPKDAAFSISEYYRP